MPKTQFSQLTYWEQRYKQTICEHYEWLCKPETLITLLAKHIDLTQFKNIMDVGCGTSHFFKHLIKEIVTLSPSHQFGELTCVDFSKELVKKMRGGQNVASFLCLDIRDMKSINSETYDLIIDKGTIDCLFCSDDMMKEVLKGMRECYRVLKENGILLIASHAKPKFRHYLFRNKLVPFQLKYERLNDKEVYVYFCRKGEGLEEGPILEEDSDGEQDQKEGNHIDQETKKGGEKASQSQKQSEREQRGYEQEREQRGQGEKEREAKFILDDKVDEGSTREKDENPVENNYDEDDFQQV